mmetsp:Transcript_35910/g.98907  ORF Transcript_35910/g.98907 Transcript_35910/m.98907 type:complete len:232 (-) Transcript_35910:40-735(-)
MCPATARRPRRPRSCVLRSSRFLPPPRQAPTGVACSCGFCAGGGSKVSNHHAGSPISLMSGGGGAECGKAYDQTCRRRACGAAALAAASAVDSTTAGTSEAGTVALVDASACASPAVKCEPAKLPSNEPLLGDFSNVRLASYSDSLASLPSPPTCERRSQPSQSFLVGALPVTDTTTLGLRLSSAESSLARFGKFECSITFSSSRARRRCLGQSACPFPATGWARPLFPMS